MANPDNVAGMARFGISSQNTLGISIPNLRALAKEIGRDHDLALRLWESGLHEGRILASFVDDPKRVTPEQMEQWVSDFDSWDVCDQVCGLFARTPYVYDRVAAWSARPEEFVKRAAFALMATLAVHDKKADDAKIAAFLPIIQREAGDGRNFVKKAVNWALRQVGKRSRKLNRLAIATAEEIAKIDSKAARWIAADALRELRSEKVRAKLK